MWKLPPPPWNQEIDRNKPHTHIYIYKKTKRQPRGPAIALRMPHVSLDLAVNFQLFILCWGFDFHAAFLLLPPDGKLDVRGHICSRPSIQFQDWWKPMIKRRCRFHGSPVCIMDLCNPHFETKLSPNSSWTLIWYIYVHFLEEYLSEMMHYFLLIPETRAIFKLLNSDIAASCFFLARFSELLDQPKQ